MGLFPKDRDLTQPPRQVELRVDASFFRARWEDFEVRLDAFLSAHMTWRSRTSVQGMIRAGHVRVDAATPDHPQGRGEAQLERRPGRRLHHGSRVVVHVPEDVFAPMAQPTSHELVVLYDDGQVLAVDKPAGVAVHPSGRHLSDTLIQRVHAVYGAGFALETSGAPRLCHRLDKETSGVVLVGLNLAAHSDVQQQFERREVGKEYLALVHGDPETEGGVIEYPIGSSRASNVGLKMAVMVDGAPCRTDWSVVERLRGAALLSCVPHTGRQHQIRVHLAAIGLPVVGDKLYGLDSSLFEKHLESQLTLDDLRTLGLPRHALHNHKVIFRSPATGRTVEVASPLAPDMAAWLEQQRLQP